MKRARIHGVAGLVILVGTASLAGASTTETLSTIANGERVGTLIAVTDGNHVSVDYKVDDNGRGPKHHEDIVLGGGGVPTSWTVNGTSLMGGAVAETFGWANGRATWTSQADRGSAEITRARLYIVNDDSPWALGVYARAALATKGHAVDVLPKGRLTITRLRDVTIGIGTAVVPVTAYRIDGVHLAPNYMMLDNAGRLFATFDALSVTVRCGYEAEAAKLIALGSALETDRVRAISAQVTHRYAEPVRIRNVHIFDPRTGTTGPIATVVVMRDRISQILLGDGGVPPTDEVVVDGEGGTVFPGLHDMHSHTTMVSGLFNLAAGVTATRDMGNNNGFLQDLLPRIATGEIAGPHITPNGFIEGRSPYSAHNGFVISTLAEGMDAVHWYADRGYFQIKFYNSMDPDFIAPLAAEAHRLGMDVTGHVPAFDTPDRVIRDGYDTIAHLNQLELGWVLKPGEDTRTPLRLTAMARTADLDLSSPQVQATVALMKAHGTSLDTTAVILERLMLSRAGQVSGWDEDFIDHVPVGYQRYLKRTYVPLVSGADDSAYTKAFHKMLAVMEMLHKQGIQLLPGTDDPNGFMLQREVELYAMSGMGNAAALRADTLDCARYLKQDNQLGTIERGKLADFVLVPGDPLQDIRLVKRPRLVLTAGAIYYPAEIYTALGIRPFAKSPPVTLPLSVKDDHALQVPPSALFSSSLDNVGD